MKFNEFELFVNKDNEISIIQNDNIVCITQDQAQHFMDTFLLVFLASEQVEEK